MKRFWGLRSFMEISDFISSVRPEQLASSGFNNILSSCEEVRECLYLADLACKELKRDKNTQKIARTIYKKALQICKNPSDFFYIARSVFENLNDVKYSQKIILRSIKAFQIRDYTLLTKQNVLRRKQMRIVIKKALSSGMSKQRFLNFLDALNRIEKYRSVCKKFYKKAENLTEGNDAYDDELLRKEELALQRIRSINAKTSHMICLRCTCGVRFACSLKFYTFISPKYSPISPLITSASSFGSSTLINGM